MKVIQNPVKTCDKVYALIQSLTSQIRKRLEDPKSSGTCVNARRYIGSHEPVPASQRKLTNKKKKENMVFFKEEKIALYIVRSENLRK